MNQDLKTNIQNLPTNYSTWAAVALAVLGYLTSTGAESFDDLVNNFSWPKLIAFLTGLIIYLGARVAPQAARQQAAAQPQQEDPPK